MINTKINLLFKIFHISGLFYLQNNIKNINECLFSGLVLKVMVYK